MMSSSTMASFITSAMNAPLHRQRSLNDKGASPDGQLTTPVPPKLSSASLPPSAILPPTPAGKINALPKKPMRPLTAYHIFFQIEREYIIQASAGEVSDESHYHNKVHLKDVPDRYKSIRLLPDWYAGPGKRRKRKHRKQHGKIGFLELSRVISTRWAQLEQIDPETKKFVTEIARRELDEYYEEMREYKERTRDLLPSSDPDPAAPNKKSKRGVDNVPSSLQMQMQAMPARPEAVPSHPNFVLPPTPLQLNRDIDYFISCIREKAPHLMPSGNESSINRMQHLLPPSFSFENQARQQQIQQPLHQVPHQIQVQRPLQQVPQQVLAQQNKRKVYQQEGDISTSCFDAPVSMDFRTPNKRQRTAMTMTPSAMSPTSAAEVDICDDEIFQLWKDSHN